MGWSGNKRLNARRDENERPIIETLEARGFSVSQINGKGIPDLLVSKHGCMWLVEVKRVKAKYNAAQIQWRSRFQGPPPRCLRTVDEAMVFPGLEVQL
jgi:Holliday junction resolvase